MPIGGPGRALQDAQERTKKEGDPDKMAEVLRFAFERAGITNQSVVKSVTKAMASRGVEISFRVK